MPLKVSMWKIWHSTTSETLIVRPLSGACADAAGAGVFTMKWNFSA
ncbi:MAG: hypothetical protein Q7R45_07810 [Sulfuricaulis sp.]|nr:hypothetical protein [Sulfuricaulis sp.]